MKISPKQNQIKSEVKSGKDTILLTGSIGTSKTYGLTLAMLSIAVQYPGSVIPVGRKNRPEIKRGTLLTFQEVANDMGLVAGEHYKENRQELMWEFTNGSLIFFTELDHTKDPQFQKIKSINATCAMIDEADGIIEDAFVMLHSRTGRKNKSGAPAFTGLTCNPNESWIAERLYKPYKKGEQKANESVIEFFPQDSFLGEDYYHKFDDMPLQWRKRYILNDWTYGDDSSSLFKYRHMDSCHIPTIESGTRYIGYDVARTGRDRSVLAMWEDEQLVDIQIFKDRDEQIDTGEQADMLWEYAKRNEVGTDNITVDAIGLGVGVIDSFKKTYGFPVQEFVSGAASEDAYNNKRSEYTYLLAQAFEKQRVSLYESCPYLTEFKKEATMHNYEILDKQTVVESKDKIKKRLGMSPDIFDAVLMGYSLTVSKSTGTVSVGSQYDLIDIGVGGDW